MQSALKVLVELDEDDVDRILAMGFERQVIANTVITQEGEHNESLFIVLDGLFGVTISSAPDVKVATLGPGELIGDISFLEGGTASATVTAIESSLLLEIKWGILFYELQNADFAAHFYRALAKLNAQRLKERVGSMGRIFQARTVPATNDGGTWGKIAEGVEGFKQAMARADTEALKHGGKISDETAATVQMAFAFFGSPLTTLIGGNSVESLAVRDELGARLRQEMLPYILLADTAERFYSKPRGYAGDFFSIELIYRNQPSGSGRLGPLIDKVFLESPPCVANRNRRTLLCDEIHSLAMQKGGPIRIATLACGPAREVFDAFERVGDRSMIKATLLDIDQQAISFVAERRESQQLQDRIDLINANLVYLAMGRHKLALEDQDLVYSLGLIDYFNDRIVLRLLNWIHARLRPGGKAILGNMYSGNVAKTFMDYALDWKMTHRSEDDMNRLFEASAFGRPCTRMQIESAQANIFAECIKQ